LIFKESTYRFIAFAFITLFLSFIVTPTVLLTAIDDDLDVSMAFYLVEDETKETKLVYVRQGDQEVPVLVQTKKPEVRGVFIIAKGVENATVKKWVVESVSKVLDVPTYRISVMPK